MKSKRKTGKGNGATTLSIKPPPPRPSVIESEVFVPVAWSVLLAVSMAVVATLATLALGAALGDARWELWMAPAAGGCVGVLVFAWRCTICEADRRSLLLWPLEVATGTDIDQDGYVGEPEAEVTVEPVEPEQAPRVIYVHNAKQEQRQRQRADFRYFLRLAHDDGRGTAWRTWEDQPLPSGKQVTRPLWEMWTGRLINAGLATREYPTAPLALTGGYRQALETLRELL